MPSIEYTEIEHYSTTDICNVDIYDHEVHTTFDPSEYKQEVLDAITFDGSQDLLEWVSKEKNMSLDDIFKTLRDKRMVSAELLATGDAPVVHNAMDVIIWADKQQITPNALYMGLHESQLVTNNVLNLPLSEYSMNELFQEMLRRNIGEVI